MNTAPVLAGVLLSCSALAAEPTLYHDGWIDLNKNGTKDVYEDPSQPIVRRVADLMSRMTLDEKIGQLTMIEMLSNSPTKLAKGLTNAEIGSLIISSEGFETPAMRNRLQRLAVEQTRLGVPFVVGYDSIHGFRTVFPIPLAQSCSWEPELLEHTQTISARETAAAGIDWAFSPMVDMSRDPRWGRIAEGFGEDPWLGSVFARASVRGLQGTNVADSDRVLACLKHYVGYGATEGGRDYNTTEISEFTLRNFYLPQFKAGVDAGAWTVMSAFNELSGVPASANHHTLTDILRGEWKFSGLVVSDWGAVTQLIAQGMAGNDADAARLALTAGVDMEMVTSTYIQTLKKQVAQGQVPESVIDEAARRILTVKFAKGLFEHPYVEESLCQSAYLRPDALALSREAGAKSCVLLKNDGAVLPLSRDAKRIALIGPFAEETGQLAGCWSGRVHYEDCDSLAAAIQAKISAEAKLTVIRGCALVEPDGTNAHSGKGKQSKAADGIKQAVAAAKAADVVILALGEPGDWSGEDKARYELTLPGKQLELFEAVTALGKPVIAVVFNGRPLALGPVQEKAAALLEAWHPGVKGADGVADVLFGDIAPAGRLTASFPRSVGQVPVHYNHFNTGRPNNGYYVDGPRDPLFPFGYGLTYTTFEYGPVQVASPALHPGGTLTASVHLKNTGARAGDEVVQLYIRALRGSVAGPRPVRELKGFQKVHLEAGESRDVVFNLNSNELGFYDVQGHWLVEPGWFQLWLAKDSVSGKPAGFELTK